MGMVRLLLLPEEEHLLLLMMTSLMLCKAEVMGLKIQHLELSGMGGIEFFKSSASFPFSRLHFLISPCGALADLD